MAKLIFIVDEKDNREASKIDFTVPNDLDIWEYKRVCMRMAGAMGYTNLSIKKAFGHEYKKEADYETTQNLRAIYSGSYTI
jgi:hypothetical protein